MRSITLNKNDFSLIEKIVIPEFLNDFNPISKGGQTVLEGTKEQFEFLLEFISDELSINGFSSNFEPTGYGRALEDLINALSIIYE